MGEKHYGGGLSDTLKLASYQALRRGVQHRHAITPVDPEPGNDVIVQVRTPGHAAFGHAALYYTTDGTIPAGSRGVAENGVAVSLERVNLIWDSIVWDYVIEWQGEIPGHADGVMVQYSISAWSDDGEEIFADWPDPEEHFHLAIGHYYGSISTDVTDIQTDHFPGDTVFCYHVDTHRVPTWAQNAIIYHLFVDRFYPGDGKDWIQTDDLSDYVGGTLWGVVDKLDYLADLGVTYLWLTPTCVTSTYHRYDVEDYRKTDPRLGGDEALRAVIDGAHQRGIRVLMDMVCNHVSSKHPIFIEAQSDENSPYRDWFHFDTQAPGGYKTFMSFNVPTMPQINLKHPPARQWMIENAQFWLREFDIDGYRLDVADGAGPDFWTHFRVACRDIKPDCFVFGEITDSPERLRIYGGRLDGNLAYPMWHAIRQTFVWDEMTEAQLRSFEANHRAYLPEDYLPVVFLDSADNDRILFSAGGDTEKLKRAVTHQMALPYPVVIYYGTEVGLSQPASLDDEGFVMNRLPMPWDDSQDRDLFAFYQAVIIARRKRATITESDTTVRRGVQ